MGHRIRFTIHRDEDDDPVTGDTTRQRYQNKELYLSQGFSEMLGVSWKVEVRQLKNTNIATIFPHVCKFPKIFEVKLK